MDAINPNEVAMIVRGVRLMVTIAAALLYASGAGMAENLDFTTVKAFLAIGLFYLAFSEFQSKNLASGMICLAGVYLFQPFNYRHSVRLPETTWQHLDLVLAFAAGLWTVAPSKSTRGAADKQTAAFIFFVTKAFGNMGLFAAHFWACLSVAKWKGVLLAVFALVTPPVAIVCVAIRDAYASDRVSPYLWTLIAIIICLGCCFSAAYRMGEQDDSSSED